MTIPICDYHMHTKLCGHAVGEPEQYCQTAVKVGLKEIGFSDHAPMVTGPMPGITMAESELPLYHQMIKKVRDQFKGKLIVKVSLEADFVPGYEIKTKKMLDAYPYDYVLGSVHFIKDWGFDNPKERDRWDDQNVNQVYRDYYALLRQSAQTGYFNIIGHCDLPKKFGHRPTENMSDEVQKTAKVFKGSGVSIEINTSGTYKPIGEMYPSLTNLKIYCQAGVPLTFGSDAHDPAHVGRDFAQAVELAKAAGFKEYVTFNNRKIDQRIKF